MLCWLDMPVVYRCKACEVEITLGGFHGGTVGEYDGGLFVVCSGCGTQFLLEVANRHRGVEYFEFVDIALASVRDNARVAVMHRLRADLDLSIAGTVELLRQLPAVLFRKVSPGHALLQQSSYAAVGALLTLENPQREANPHFGPIALDRLLRRANPVSSGEEPGSWIEAPVAGREDSPGGEFDLHQQTCSECTSVGSFLSDMEPPAACPRCKKPELEYASGWVT